MPQCFEMMPQAAFRIPPCRFEARGGFFAPLADMVLTLTAPQVPLTALRLLESVLPSGTVRRIETAPALTLTWMRPEATLPFPKLETSAGPEAFAFTITPEGIAACAASAEGLFRLCAWLYRELSRGALPCGCGMDAPDKPIRGVMLDVSRNRIYSVQTLCNIIDLMALVGLNQLELYFENTFAYRDHATVWAHTSPYTPEDITVIAAYASARFVRLVPNQNTLGHFERWLKHPAYLQYAELPEGGARTPWGSIQQHPTGLYAADRKTRDFVKGLLTELLPCFPMADRVNLGGDEVFDLGQGRSATSDKAGLYLSYMREMADVAQRFGKQPELWADMLLRHPEMIPLAKTVLPEAIWVVWGYEATDPLEAYVARLQAAGLRVMVAPGTSSWRSFCGRTANMLANITAAAATPAEGLLLTDWGDAGHWQPFVVSLPAILFAAAKAWRMTAAPDLADWIDALTHQRGLGAWLLQLGNTYQTAHAEAGNATKLFQAYNLPLANAPDLDPEALQNTLNELIQLAEVAATFGTSLWAQEARLALNLQLLAVRRALKHPGLQRERAKVAAQLEQMWLARGPRAQLDDSLNAFLAQELPE